jgi:hypothetical protein
LRQHEHRRAGKQKRNNQPDDRDRAPNAGFDPRFEAYAPAQDDPFEHSSPPALRRHR